MRKMIVPTLVLTLLLGLLAPLTALADGFAGDYLNDQADVLLPEEAEQLEAAAAAISQEYDCGVYIATVSDYNDYSTQDEIEASREYFWQYDLRANHDGDGVLLFLDVGNRKVVITATGDYALTVFTDAAKDYIRAEYLPHFSEDDWAGGVEAYLEGCEYALYARYSGDEGAFAGYEESAEDDGSIVAILGVSLLVAALVCWFLESRMKTARRQTRASEYITGAGVSFRIREDRFTHVTETRVKIQRGNKNGNGGGNGGFSSKSDSF